MIVKMISMFNFILYFSILTFCTKANTSVEIGYDIIEHQLTAIVDQYAKEYNLDTGNRFERIHFKVVMVEAEPMEIYFEKKKLSKKFRM